MLKKKKFWLITAAVVVLLLVGGLGFAGNYLVDYALAVDDQGRIGSMGDGVYTGKQDTQAQQEYDAWVKTVETKELHIQSDDGLKLWAKYYHGAKDSHRYVLAVHGYTVDNRDIAPAIVPFVKAGYHVITPDQRGRGQSEGTYLGMGWLEKDDVVNWVEKIVHMDKQAEIVLYGESMGAATVMMASGEKLPANVKAVVEDCGYTSASAMFKNQLKERFGLPDIPFLPAAAVVSQLRAGYNFYDASAIDQIAKSNLPILFIHGGADDYVPTSMGRELYKSYHGEKELLIVAKAGHGQSADVDPETYYHTVFQFLAKYL